jgi:hypothetical protein
VVVGENEPVARDDEAGSRAFLDLGALVLELREEVLEPGRETPVIDRLPDVDRIKTTAGFTCSATATNASPSCAAGPAAGIGGGGAAWKSAAGCAAVFFGRSSAEAKSRPNTNASPTSPMNFIQSFVRTDIVIVPGEEGYFLPLSSSTIS